MRAHTFVAKGTITIVLGLAVGYALGVSVKHDAAKGRSLTMAQYVADYAPYRQKLQSGEIPMAASVLIGTMMIVAAIGTYELLAFGLAKLIAKIDLGTGAAATP